MTLSYTHIYSIYCYYKSNNTLRFIVLEGKVDHRKIYILLVGETAVLSSFFPNFCRVFNADLDGLPGN